MKPGMQETSATTSGIAYNGEKTKRQPGSKCASKFNQWQQDASMHRSGSITSLSDKKPARQPPWLLSVFSGLLLVLLLGILSNSKMFSGRTSSQLEDRFHPSTGASASLSHSMKLQLHSPEGATDATRQLSQRHPTDPNWDPAESPPENFDEYERPGRRRKKKGGSKKGREGSKGKKGRDRDKDRDKDKEKNRERSKGRVSRRREEEPLPFNPLEPRLRRSHPCSNFTLPPPPIDPKRSGPRACPVCYLDVEDAVALRPQPHRSSSEPVLRELTFVTGEDAGERQAIAGGKRARFAGHQTLQERAESFEIKEKMRVHCGFVVGGEPGTSTGFDSSAEDRAFMRSCEDVVVASAIFGAYDLVQQPSGMSDVARHSVCFVMFVDEFTFNSLLQDGTLRDDGKRQLGLWRLVVVSNLPYKDPRRTGKIPKLLAHRLFPSAQFAIWVDAKLELRVDPYRLLERFLWRGNFTWAISRHYARFDIFTEAERNKAAGKYRNTSIDEQMDAYRREGMTAWTPAKMPIISDVPEGCVIIRELTPLSNLLACLWFNEVDRFTSRDQLSFGFCRDKIRAGVPGWNANMFLDCERRNFVAQSYHKHVLKEKFGNTSKAVQIDKA